ncbi:MAG: hypothetical protein ACE5GY_06470 [Thermodesulfobacteriota bacterium]
MPNYELILSRNPYLLGMELRIFWSIASLYALSFLLFLFHALTRSAAAQTSYLIIKPLARRGTARGPSPRIT